MIKDIWHRIDNNLKNNFPEVYEDLNNGVDENELLEAEAYLNIKFPDDFRETLKIHNGQKGKENLFLIDGWRLLDLETILESWDYLNKLISSGNFSDLNLKNNKSILNAWWDKKWIPITSSIEKDFNCIDLNPSVYGNKGQIITLWSDILERDIYANSFTNFLEIFANGLENNKYSLMEEYNGLVFND